MKAAIRMERENTCRLQLQGSLTTGQWQKVMGEFETISQQGIRTLIVDLQEVPLIDGLGLAALIAGYRLFGSDSTRFRLEGLGSQPQLLLQVAGANWLVRAV